MASNCLIICSEDSKQEIIDDGDNGLVIKNFDKKDAKRIVDANNNKVKKEKMLVKSTKGIKNYSLEKWSKDYFDCLIK